MIIVVFNGAVIILGKSRVAIIGAGISGLACALELKRNGITPVVFEKSSNPGGNLDYIISALRIFSDFQSNPVKYLKSEYKIDLKPENVLNEILMKGPTRSVTIKGKLGYTFYKGLKNSSIENQLASATDIDISFDTFINIRDIENDFDHIVVATGSHTIPYELGLWNLTFQAHTRIAEILGEFKPGQIVVWLNRTYSNSGYAYMIATGTRKADLVLIVTGITGRELDHYWREFLRGEKINNTILNTYDIEQHIGYTMPSKAGKLYFVGNVGGMIDNFTGVGAIRSIESGILAARAIAGKCDFNSVMKPYLADVGVMQEYRRALNNFDNEDYDRLLSFIGLPLIKQAIYNNPFYRFKYTAFIPRLYNRFTGKNS